MIAPTCAGFGWSLLTMRQMRPREIVRDRALAEGLDEPIWLGLDDEWPDCAGEPNCQLVREARGQ